MRPAPPRVPGYVERGQRATYDVVRRERDEWLGAARRAGRRVNGPVVVEYDDATSTLTLWEGTAADRAELFDEIATAVAAARYTAEHWGNPPTELVELDAEQVTPVGPLRELGTLVALEYEARKGRTTARWVHEMGTEPADPDAPQALPVLAVDQAGRLVIVGGTYTVGPEGIRG